MRRRDFVKAGLMTAGGLFLPRIAHPWWHLAGGRKYYPYATWETDNADANTFACIFDGEAGASEYGQGGGLAGDDLRLKSEGDPAGSRGTDPPYRLMDGDDDTFHGTTAAFKSLIADGSGTWTVLIFFKSIGDSGNARNIFWTPNGTDNHELRLSKDANDKFSVLAEDSGSQEIDTTTDAIPSAEIILGAWADNINPIRGGFVSGEIEPTKWSDFNANNRVELASIKGDWSAWNGADDMWLFMNVSIYLSCKIATIKISKNCLIDNAL